MVCNGGEGVRGKGGQDNGGNNEAVVAAVKQYGKGTGALPVYSPRGSHLHVYEEVACRCQVAQQFLLHGISDHAGRKLFRHQHTPQKQK